MTGALLDHLWQSTLFGAAIWSITLCLRGNSAAVRHGLWLTASLKFLVPFSALYLLGAAAGIPPPVESQPAFFPAALDVAAPVLSPVMASGHATRESFLWPVVGGVWLVISACLSLSWWRGWRMARRLSLAARPAPGSLPDVRVTDAIIEPSVARVIHPVVLLPASLPERLTPDQLLAVLAHEREHIARFDLLKAQLHRLVTVLFWFHPLVWFIGRRLVEERERACDEAVLAAGHEPEEYAAGILAVCRHCAGAGQRHAVSALSGDLTQRVGHILDNRSPASLGFLKSFTLSLAACVLVIGPLFAGTVAEAARHRQKLERDTRVLMNANLEVRTVGSGTASLRLSDSGMELNVASSSLRELLAMAYGVTPAEVKGLDWLDNPRYDIRAVLPESVTEPDDFDPMAMRGLVTQLLAARFNLEIHVNHHCQDPCGPRALAARRR